jgi:hypothetical protein
VNPSLRDRPVTDRWRLSEERRRAGVVPRRRALLRGVCRVDPGKAHRSLPGRWLVSLSVTSLGPEVDAWIVVIEQFATSMCR